MGKLFAALIKLNLLFKDDALRRRCFEEIDVLKRLTAIPNSKDYFVQFLDSYEDSEIGGGTSMYIVMEYCKYGTLRCVNLHNIVATYSFRRNRDQFN